MAKLDRIKEFINYLKVLLVLLLASDISLIGWIANHYQTAEKLLLNVAMLVVIIVLVITIFINKKIIKDIKSLEEL